MKEPLPVRATAAIETGLKVARENPVKDSPNLAADDYIAWCVWNELRRAGFKVVESGDPAEEPNWDTTHG
jgi:hypothetical protein